MKPQIVVADDHAIVLEGLRRILEPEFNILATASDGRELIAAIEKHKPEVAVADISMPSLNGIDALRQCREAKLRVRFVFLTASPDVSLATQAFRLGASGYVLKQSAAEELVGAVREAIAGRTYITPRIATEVLQNLMHPAGGSMGTHDLTTREREVLQLLAEGKILKEIGAILNVSPRTVEFHKNNIAAKTGLHSTAELARYAARLGLVPPLD
ncbi:MAG: response regulator transcription factor [Acidobacteriota bacterium]|nr:response regulator transcription factor [Acidobacteriota bacterium]